MELLHNGFFIGIVIGGGFVAAVINALIGAVILLLVIRLVKRA